MAKESSSADKAEVPENINAAPKNRSGSWLPGFFLILMGLYFLANNLSGFTLDNWWALFILIPAANNFSDSLRVLRREGHLSRKSRGHFFWSIFFVMLSAAFLLSLDFSLFWPVFLIFAGLGVLFGAF